MESKDLVYTSIQMLPRQIMHTIEETRTIAFPDRYKTAANVAIAGMGGSLFSYHIISALYPHLLTAPLVAVNDYRLPSFVDHDSLFIASSYSGATEEVLQTAKEAKDKGAMVTGITIGDSLGELLDSYEAPFFKVNPEFNPSGQPRIGVGYMIFGMVQLLRKLGFLKVEEQEITQAAEALEKENEKIADQAHDFVRELDDSGLIYVAAEHLSGAAHVVRNQTNESAKTFAEYNLIPELNHHFMEGLTFPKNKNITFVFYTSNRYSPRIQKRMALTKEVIEKQGVEVRTVVMGGSSHTQQFMQYLQFGSYLTYFLAKKRGVDAAQVPWVDYFKKKLAE